MGLDMYLYAERYVWYNEEELSDKVRDIFPELPKEVNIKTVVTEAGYWRKANQIHKWFVDNVQDGVDECQKTEVSREDLAKLRSLCEQVLLNRDQAPVLLPSASGFFFGSTEYDEWYFKDLELTVEIINRALALPDRWDFYYRSSW